MDLTLQFDKVFPLIFLPRYLKLWMQCRTCSILGRNVRINYLRTTQKQMKLISLVSLLPWHWRHYYRHLHLSCGLPSGLRRQTQTAKTGTIRHIEDTCHKRGLTIAWKSPLCCHLCKKWFLFVRNLHFQWQMAWRALEQISQECHGPSALSLLFLQTPVSCFLHHFPVFHDGCHCSFTTVATWAGDLEAAELEDLLLCFIQPTASPPLLPANPQTSSFWSLQCSMLTTHHTFNCATSNIRVLQNKVEIKGKEKVNVSAVLSSSAPLSHRQWDTESVQPIKKLKYLLKPVKWPRHNASSRGVFVWLATIQ